MKFKLLLFLILLTFGSAVSAEDFDNNSSQISALQKYRSRAKLYAPNFVLINKETTFRVVADKNSKITLVIDYGSRIEKESYEADTNENGVAVFNIKIRNEEDLVGKSIAVDAYIRNKNNSFDVQKAVMQTETGHPSQTNRVYVADSESSKGFMFSPIQQVSQFMINNNFDERSGFTPASDLIYNTNTPVYVRNMRDAQDNVRTVPTNINNSN